MTRDEKLEASMAEFMGAMRQIANETRNLTDAKWIAAVSIRNVHVICSEGRIPNAQESIDWVRHNVQTFTQ